MRKSFSTIICFMIIISMIAGCGTAVKPDAAPGSENQNAVAENGSDKENSEDPQKNTTPSPAPTDEPEPEKEFTFNPKVSSAYIEEIYGETMVQTWYNFVDAVMAGKNTFECPDQFTYDWVIGQFPNKCFPILEKLIVPINIDSVKNGVAKFEYKTSKKKTRKRIRKFAKQVEDVLNSCMKADYSDLEKALSLYIYFSKHYTYDYETFEKLYDEDVDYLSACRLFNDGMGICQEISTAYSYLLMQAGVDATVMMGDDHQWSYVRINGKNYHIDPTFVLDDPQSLTYFMMTDKQRSIHCSRKNFLIVGTYVREYGSPKYKAKDDTFAPLWYTYFEEMDRENHTIYSYEDDIDGNRVEKEFDYEGF